jgi:hypothetical protein
MAVYETIHSNKSIDVTTSLQGCQFCFTGLNGNGQLVLPPFPEDVVGVIQDKPGVDDPCFICGPGDITKVRCGAAFAAGVPITSDELGHCLPAGSADPVLGWSLSAGGAGSLALILFQPTPGPGGTGGGGGGGTPAGANMQIQYNNAGAFGADAALTWYSGAGSVQLTIGTASSTTASMTLSNSTGYLVPTADVQGNQISSMNSAYSAAVPLVMNVSALVVGWSNTTAPGAAYAYMLNVNGDCNLTPGSFYRVNDVPLPVVVAAAAPAAPYSGQLWYDTATLHLFCYVSTAWVQVSA